MAAQREDPGSILCLARDLIALRKHRWLLRGAYEAVETPEGVWAFRREGGALVAINLGDAPVELDGASGTIVIGTDRGRDEEPVDGVLRLGPREAAVIAT